MKQQRALLGELCSLTKGTSPISKTPPGPYPLITTGEEHKTANTFQLDSEAVCIPLISSTGHGHASLKRVHYQAGKFALANLLAAAVVKDRSILSTRFLARYLMFAKDRLIVPLMTGAANMSISMDRLASVPVDLPSLGDQQRIVKLLDEADELRKLRTEADRRTADLIPALFHEMFGDVNSKPNNWPVVPFNEIGAARLGKMLDAKQQTGKLKRVYLRNANVQWGRLELDDLLEMDFSEADRKEFRLKYGELLICEGGEVGRTAIWRDELPECYFQKALHRVRLHPSKAVPEFVLSLMHTMAKENGFRDYVGTATIPHLTGIKLASIRIPLPPLALQKEFASRVAEIRELEARQTASRERLDAFFQSMLHRAFRGEL
jgi:type I restriction enzyme S subunit